MGKGGYRKGRKRPNDSGPGGYASRQKHANGEGDYPPEHVLENPAFETYYRESGIVPEAEWDAVWKPWPTRPASAAQAASGSCPRLAEAQGSLERDLALRAALGAPADRRPEPACWPTQVGGLHEDAAPAAGRLVPHHRRPLRPGRRRARRVHARAPHDAAHWQRSTLKVAASAAP